MLDADIRRALLQHLAAHPLIVKEMGVCGQVRCDVVALSEEMVGYEIKSDADTLRRLPRQVEWYSRVLDRAHVVTTERHLEGVQGVVPEWWGVMVASGPADDVRLQPLREAGANPVPGHPLAGRSPVAPRGARGPGGQGPGPWLPVQDVLGHGRPAYRARPACRAALAGS